MNEILQKRIEEAAKEIGKKFYFVGMNPNEAAYKAAIQMGNKILRNQWISVEEALPEVDGHGYSNPVLVIDDTNELLVSTYSKIYDKWNVVGPVSYHRLVVTHWMPIPSLEGGEK